MSLLAPIADRPSAIPHLSEQDRPDLLKRNSLTRFQHYLLVKIVRLIQGSGDGSTYRAAVRTAVSAGAQAEWNPPQLCPLEWIDAGVDQLIECGLLCSAQDRLTMPLPLPTSSDEQTPLPRNRRSQPNEEWGQLQGPLPSLKFVYRAAERLEILRVLQSCGWVRAEAIKTLGINRTTLYKKMQSFGISETDRLPESSADEPHTIPDSPSPEMWNPMEMAERAIVLEALERSAWNREDAARMLGTNRTSLYFRMKKYGIAPDSVIAEASFLSS